MEMIEIYKRINHKAALSVLYINKLFLSYIFFDYKKALINASKFKKSLI